MIKTFNLFNIDILAKNCHVEVLKLYSWIQFRKLNDRIGKQQPTNCSLKLSVLSHVFIKELKQIVQKPYHDIYFTKLVNKALLMWQHIEISTVFLVNKVSTYMYI